jgi:hypothetical protein
MHFPKGKKLLREVGISHTINKRLLLNEATFIYKRFILSRIA